MAGELRVCAKFDRETPIANNGEEQSLNFRARPSATGAFRVKRILRQRASTSENDPKRDVGRIRSVAMFLAKVCSHNENPDHYAAAICIRVRPDCLLCGYSVGEKPAPVRVAKAVTDLRRYPDATRFSSTGRRLMSLCRGKADVPWKPRHFRFLTRNRH